ncbi:hypothetical protein GGP41_000042 [Bipolaris sorokiniana]|uniref:Uncharacterized protein n=1 Tax=Cochliobolus sativus TaxID=45130 RepID=A0A8H6DTE4_COCSA|nr:hypothetical protein GGP41_000042 [Bipolaris sorokiniana]
MSSESGRPAAEPAASSSQMESNSTQGWVSRINGRLKEWMAEKRGKRWARGSQPQHRVSPGVIHASAMPRHASPCFQKAYSAY